jgi:hypothetical protein
LKAIAKKTKHSNVSTLTKRYASDEEPAVGYLEKANALFLGDFIEERL